MDTPLPALLPGATTQHLYSVPGVINGGGLGTFFSCTSTAPGATVTFGTSAAAGISIDSGLAAGPVSKGSARILATSKSLICTAFVADTFGAPTASGWQLTIIAKTKQKAAN